MKQKHTQNLKDRANVLQAHLKTAGINLPRMEALNLLAKLDGYRSFTAVHHGRQHNHPGVLAQALGKIRTLKEACPVEEVQEDYLANGGQHCPDCGCANIYDERNSNADFRKWEQLMGCWDCNFRWWAVYELSTRDGFRLGTKKAQEALQSEACPYCGDKTDLDYGTVVMGTQGYQSVRCNSCVETWMDVYRLAEFAETEDE